MTSRKPREGIVTLRALPVPGQRGIVRIMDGDREVRRVSAALQDAYLRVEEERAKYGDPTPRACMSCARPFLSEGIHNRLCPKCRSGSPPSHW